MHSIGSTEMWVGFIAFVIVVMILDVFCLGGGKEHRVSVKEALVWSGFWVLLALIFNGWLWHAYGAQRAGEFFGVYLLEKSLSVDNIFVFILIFNYFAIPSVFQRRVLLWGILGAIFFRAVMILLGAMLIKEFAWILYVFGFFLAYTGVKIFFAPDSEQDLATHPFLKWLRKHFKITDGLRGSKFLVREQGAVFMTPLLVALVFIEITDIIFAIDSVPAAFGVTEDPFIIFTANIFAILGLRALFFVLAHWMDRFHLLKYGLALILVFIGGKMLIHDVYKLPISAALGVIVLILAVSVFLSFRLKPGHFSLNKEKKR